MIYNVQTQVLIGTVLGGSSLLKPPKGINYYLSMRGQDKNWILYKMSEMSDIFKDLKFHKYGTTYRCNSSCNSMVTEIYYKLYKDGKRKINMEILNVLTDASIAMWFLDSGSKTGRNNKNAYINTTKFGEDGSNIIKQYFCEIGMKCNINHDGIRLKVLFSVEGTEMLFKTIAHRFPLFMCHRL